MATGTVMPSPVFTGLDNNGDPLSGGKLYTYAAGTTTPLATYSDVGLTTPNANPIILDSGGRATVFLSATSYKFVLKTSADVTVWTQDGSDSAVFDASIAAFMRVFVLGAIAWWLSGVRDVHRQLSYEVEMLEGLLPICSYCKKIRDDEGEWQVLEKYIQEHSAATFTHGVCQTCLDRELAEQPRRRAG